MRPRPDAAATTLPAGELWVGVPAFAVLGAFELHRGFLRMFGYVEDNLAIGGEVLWLTLAMVVVWGLAVLGWGWLHVHGRVGPTARAGLLLALYGVTAHETSRFAIETLLHRARGRIPEGPVELASWVAATGLVAYGLGLGLAGVATLADLRRGAPKPRT